MSITELFRGAKKEANQAYVDLVTHYPLRPIQGEEDYLLRNSVLHRILDLPSTDPQTFWYMDVLTLLIEEYDKVHHPDPDVPPSTMLAHLMDQFNITQAELSRRMDVSPGLVCDLLKGRANFTVKRIHQLAAIFDVDPAVFL